MRYYICMTLTSIEICAGGGGQALGVEQAGFEHTLLVERDPWAVKTLRHNRPDWSVLEEDLLKWDPTGLESPDLFAGGVPCPPFSQAGKQLGAEDERNLFDKAMDFVEILHPRSIMLENVRGLLSSKFNDYREHILNRLDAAGYKGEWKLLYAKDFGVPQLRPRAILVALPHDLFSQFSWPIATVEPATVGETLVDLMGQRGWKGAQEWAKNADSIAPTVVGGSHKHGGADLGPSRARAAWAKMGVKGTSLAELAPDPDFEGDPRLTPRMLARIQGFPDDWEFVGKKTQQCRQIGNAFPPPIACAVAEQIHRVLA